MLLSVSQYNSIMLQLGACCIILGHTKQYINVTCKNMQCYVLHLKSACAHMFQCCVIQEFAEHLMTEPLSQHYWYTL